MWGIQDTSKNAVTHHQIKGISVHGGIKLLFIMLIFWTITFIIWTWFVFARALKYQQVCTLLFCKTCSFIVISIKSCWSKEVQILISLFPKCPSDHILSVPPDGFAFSQEEHGVMGQSEVIRAYDTTQPKPGGM